MIGNRQASKSPLAAWLQAACVLLCAGTASAIDGIVPENALRATWSPSRDDAVLVDSQPPVRSAQHEEVEPPLPVESPLSSSRLMQRPKSLSRPAPATMSVMRQPPLAQPTPARGESLPSVAGTPMSPEGLPVPPGSEYYPEGSAIDGLPGFGGYGGYGYGGCGSCLPGGCINCGCDCGPPNCCGNWNSCGPVSPCCLLPRVPLNGLEFFGGVQGFTGPVNRGGSASFGFHEGFNFGFPACGCVAWQWGANWTQSSFDGSFFTSDMRNQIFVTGGMFRRVDWGLQGGLVVDYLHDEWDYSADLLQLRGEASWKYCGCHEVGCWFTVGVNDADNLPLSQPVQGSANGIAIVPGIATIEVNDLFAFFYRRQFANGGEGRAFGGFTSNNQGLVGADVALPINCCWSVRGGFIYVTPDSNASPQRPDFAEESWNVGISLVWTPCPRQPCVPNYCRPLFNVADNGSFLTRLVPRSLVLE